MFISNGIHKAVNHKKLDFVFQVSIGFVSLKQKLTQVFIYLCDVRKQLYYNKIQSDLS